MKKILKTLGVVVATLLVVLMVAPFAFRDKLIEVVKSEGNKLLNAQFDFADLDISLLRNFPQASVTLEDFWLKGVDVFENDTLVYAGEVTAAVNLRSLIDGNYEISKILVADTRLRAIVLEDGRVNWDVMKPSDEVKEVEAEEESEPVSFKVALKQLSIDNLTAVYDDRKGGMYAAVQALEAQCSGDLGSDETTIKLEAATPSVTFRMGGVPMLSRARITADMDVAADLKNMRFELEDNELSLNAIRAAIDGWAQLNGEAVDMDLALNTNNIGFKEILSLIPAIYMKDFADLRTDGVATLRATAKGRMVGDNLPALDVALDVKNAMFQYPALPAGVEAINIAARVQNPGGSIDLTTVEVNPFDFTLAGNPFSVVADVKTPISDPEFKASAKGKLDLGKIKDVYPLENMNLGGVVDADMSVAGRLSYIEKEQFDRVEAEGSVSLSDMLLKMDSLPDVMIERSTFGFTPRYLELSKTTVKVGENDLTLDSRFENYMGYVLKGTTLKGTLNVSSKHVNLNDFMTSAEDEATAEPTEEVVAESAEPSATTVALRVPNNIDFRAQVDMAEVLMDKLSFRDINGVLVVRDSKVDMQNLSLSTMGGKAVANGSYATLAGEPARLNAAFALTDISFAEAYRDLDMVQSMAPIFSSLTGQFSGSVKVNTLLDEQMSPVLPSLDGEGRLSTRDVSLGEVKFLTQVADLLKKASLKDTRVKDLSIEFTIEDGRIITKPFDVKLGDYVMNLSGSTGLDQTIDYRGKITLPASAGELARLGTVDMTITGTFSSPKVGLDLESIAKQAVDKVKQQVEEKAEEIVEQAKQQAQEKAEEVKQQAEQKVEEVKQQAQQKAEQAVEQAKQQAQEKAEEAAKDAVSKLLGGQGAAAAEVADSTATTTEKKGDVVKGVLNLLKKKN